MLKNILSKAKGTIMVNMCAVEKVNEKAERADTAHTRVTTRSAINRSNG